MRKKEIYTPKKGKIPRINKHPPQKKKDPKRHFKRKELKSPTTMNS